jgi:hypothetical protein
VIRQIGYSLLAAWIPRFQTNPVTGHCENKLSVAAVFLQMDSVTGLYANKPRVAAVFPLLGPEAVEP